MNAAAPDGSILLGALKDSGTAKEERKRNGVAIITKAKRSWNVPAEFPDQVRTSAIV